MHSSHMLKTLSLSGLALLLIGCGGGSENTPPRAAVKGKVLIDNQPLPKGVIRFVPKGETEGPKISATIENGTFSLSGDLGPWVGTHRVEIESTDDGGFAMDDEQAFQKLQQQGIKKIEAVRVPAIYNQHSKLEAKILPEQENELEYKLDMKTAGRSR